MELNVMEILNPILVAIAGAVGTLLAIFLKKGTTWVSEWISTKVGKENYDHAMEVAQGIYIYLEDKYKDEVMKMGEVKRQEMYEMLLEKFPNLSQVELDSINKAVWLSFNEQWFDPEPEMPTRIDE